MNTLASIDVPSKEDEFNVVHGLTQAVEELVKPSDLQTSLRAGEETANIENRGRIICLSHAKRLV